MHPRRPAPAGRAAGNWPAPDLSFGKLGRRRRALAGGAALLAAAAATVLVGVRWSQRDRGVIRVQDRTRPLEARLTLPEADRHRPYDRERGKAGRALPDYRSIARLERTGDTAGVVGQMLLAGMVNQAAQHLAAAERERSLDSDRAALALVMGKPGEAFAWAERALGRTPGSPQASWNQALALRDMGLPLAAAAAFARVAAHDEPGWASEARSWQRRLQSEVETRKARYGERQAHIRALMWQWQEPPEELVASWPDLVRAAFYEAACTATRFESLQGLSGLAAALDQRFGGGALRLHVQGLGRLDWGRRAPLAARYARLAKAGWRETQEGELTALAADLRRAGAAGRDLLMGLIMARPHLASYPAEAGRLAASRKDAWLITAAQEVEALCERDLAVGGAQERALREAIQNAKDGGFSFLRLRLENHLVRLLLNQHRSIDAAPAARAALAQARQQGLWLEELQLQERLVSALSQQQDTAGVIAHVREIELSDEACGPVFQFALARLTERLVYDGRHDEGRRELARLLRCAASGEVPPMIFSALSELAQRDAGALATLRTEVARHRSKLAARGPVVLAQERYYLDALEGRALFGSDPGAGRKMLEEVLAATDLPGKTALDTGGPRLLAFRRLVSDATRSGDFARALSLMAREAKVVLPEGCLLGVSEDVRLASVVARVDGRYLGAYGTPALAAAPEKAVPPDIARALAGCGQVAVVASSPLRGRARLLPPALAWRHLAGPDEGPASPWSPARRVVVSDITPPADSELPTLPPWQSSGSGPVHRHLRGAEANPVSVLRELERADLIEFHVHGVADFHRSDAPHLMLSPDPQGNGRLTAEAIRTRRLAQRPFVVLAACDSAANSPFVPSYSGQLGLPMAFLEAGARAVLAADRPIPDRAASIFVAQLMEKIQAGVDGAIALRDVRQIWLKQSDSDWANEVVLFQ